MSSSLAPFFAPRVVAVVGASRRRGRIGTELFRSVLTGGYRGTVIPVNPAATSVEGVMAFPRVTDIPLDVDLAVIAVPCQLVEGVVDDCRLKNVKAIVVISAGFGETGAEGRAREARIVEKVRAAGIRLVGPNCMGLINTHPDVSLNATFSTDLDAREMIDGLKGRALLRSYRGAPPADEAALCEALLRVSALVEACPQIAEMDLNPVKVLPRGLSVVDVRIRVA